MASGAQHERASTQLIYVLQPLVLSSMGVAAIAVWLGYASGFYALLFGVCAFGYLFGLYVGRRVTPDLDIDEVGTRQTRRYRRKYRTMGWVWRFFWWPYAKLHVHRGIAHTPFLGTLGRFVYLFIIPISILLYWARVNAFLFFACLLFWLWVYAGQSSQDLLHIWMDR